MSCILQAHATILTTTRHLQTCSSSLPMPAHLVSLLRSLNDEDTLRNAAPALTRKIVNHVAAFASEVVKRLDAPAPAGKVLEDLLERFLVSLRVRMGFRTDIVLTFCILPIRQSTREPARPSSDWTSDGCFTCSSPSPRRARCRRPPTRDWTRPSASWLSLRRRPPLPRSTAAQSDRHMRMRTTSITPSHRPLLLTPPQSPHPLLSPHLLKRRNRKLNGATPAPSPKPSASPLSVLPTARRTRSLALSLLLVARVSLEVPAP